MNMTTIIAIEIGEQFGGFFRLWRIVGGGVAIALVAYRKRITLI